MVESYLILFEEAIKRQAEIVGADIAEDQARKAGLYLAEDGSICSCAGNPLVVLLRLIRFFTENKNIAALEACTPLINKLTELQEKSASIS